MASFSRQKPLTSKNKNDTIVWNKKFYHCAKFELYRIKDAKSFSEHAASCPLLARRDYKTQNGVHSVASPVKFFSTPFYGKQKHLGKKVIAGKKQHHIGESVSKRAFRLSVFSFGVFTLSKLIQTVSSAHNQTLYL